MESQDGGLLKRLFSLSGKTAIISGGSRGIGAMIARGFVESGVRTYITARKAEACSATAEQLGQFGECIALPANLSSVDGIAAFVQSFSEREEKLDILVNNAGAAWGASLEDYPESGWDKVFDINLKSLFFMTQKLLPLLKAAGTARDPARIINTASVDGLSHPHAENYAYSSSKAGVIHLT